MQVDEDEEEQAVEAVHGAAMAFRAGDVGALCGGLAEILEKMRERERWKGERALRAQQLNTRVSKELGLDMTTWLCRFLMKDGPVASLAEELIEELSAARREEVLLVPFKSGGEPGEHELKLSVGHHVVDWTMADGRFIWHGATAALKLLGAGVQVAEEAEEAAEAAEEAEAEEVIKEGREGQPGRQHGACLDPRLDVSGKAVLELGCGLGVVGLACARLGARRVVLSDYDQELLKACERSVALNSLDQVSTLHLDWNAVSSGVFPADLDDETFDLLLGADIIYDADHAASVLGTICRFLQTARAKEAVLITGEPDRRQGVKQLDEALGADLTNWHSGRRFGQHEHFTWTAQRILDEDRAHRVYRFSPRP